MYRNGALGEIRTSVLIGSHIVFSRESDEAGRLSCKPIGPRTLTSFARLRIEIALVVAFGPRSASPFPFGFRPSMASTASLGAASVRTRGRYAPTFARTSARRKRSMNNMNSTDGTNRISAVIEATW